MRRVPQLKQMGEVSWVDSCGPCDVRGIRLAIASQVTTFPIFFRAAAASSLETVDGIARA